MGIKIKLPKSMDVQQSMKALAHGKVDYRRPGSAPIAEAVRDALVVVNRFLDDLEASPASEEPFSLPAMLVMSPTVCAVGDMFEVGSVFNSLDPRAVTTMIFGSLVGEKKSMLKPLFLSERRSVALGLVTILLIMRVQVAEGKTPDSVSVLEKARDVLAIQLELNAREITSTKAA